MTHQTQTHAHQHSRAPPSPLHPPAIAYVSISPRSIGSTPRPFAAAALAAAADARHIELQLITTFRDWVTRGLVVCLLLSLLTLMLLQTEVLRALKGAISEQWQRRAAQLSALTARASRRINLNSEEGLKLLSITRFCLVLRL